MCIYLHLQILECTHLFFCSLQRIPNNVRTVLQTERCSNSMTLRMSLSVHECCVSCSVASGRAVVPELQRLTGAAVGAQPDATSPVVPTKPGPWGGPSPEPCLSCFIKGMNHFPKKEVGGSTCTDASSWYPGPWNKLEREVTYRCTEQSRWDWCTHMPCYYRRY